MSPLSLSKPWILQHEVTKTERLLLFPLDRVLEICR